MIDRGETRTKGAGSPAGSAIVPHGYAYPRSKKQLDRPSVVASQIKHAKELMRGERVLIDWPTTTSHTHFIEYAPEVAADVGLGAITVGRQIVGNLTTTLTAYRAA